MVSLARREGKGLFGISRDMRIAALRTTFSLFDGYFVFHSMKGLSISILLSCLCQIRCHLLANHKLDHQFVELLDRLGVFDELVVRANGQLFVDLGPEAVFNVLISGY